MADSDDVEGEKALRDQVAHQRLGIFIDRIREWQGCSAVAVYIDHNYPGGAAAVAAVGMDRIAATADCEKRMARTREKASGKDLAEAEKMYAEFRDNPAALVVMTALDAMQVALAKQMEKGES